MSEACPKTGLECNILTALHEHRALRAEEGGTQGPMAAETSPDEYDETLALIQKDHCSADFCGIIEFADLIIAAAAKKVNE